MSQEITPHESITWLIKEVAETKQLIEVHLTAPKITSDWIPRSEVMKFFDYGDTQMGALEKNSDLVVAKIGSRKFIERNSILRLLEKSTQKD
ncbi:MAG: hypothetical protein EOO10_25990 [Chitinophagaceae bacterium]|nr:MAG: hypothetical protein EOO10_25990 [Chitinophagaceae bacterium]